MQGTSTVRLLGAAAACAVLVLAACSDDKGNVTTSGSGASLAPPESTVAPDDGSGAPAAAPSTVPTGPCDAMPLPANPTTLGTTEADVDHDGIPDTVTLYSAGDPTPYRLRIELGNSRGAVDTVVTGPEGGDPTEPPGLIGVADISPSGDGSGDEIALTVAHGAATTQIGFYQLNGCDLVPLRRQGEANLAVFSLGGPVTMVSGVRCDRTDGPPQLIEVTGTSSDGATYATTEQAWQVANGEFEKAGPPTDLPGTAAPSSGLDCFSLQM